MPRTDEASDIVAVIVGVGLVGSTVLLHLHERARRMNLALVLIDPDVVEDKTCRALAFRNAEKGVAKVDWLRRTHLKKLSQVWAIKEPVQQLGEGFWQWVAGRGHRVTIFDCADTSSAHCYVGDVPRRLVRPVIVQTGVARRRGLVRIFAPARSSACFRCLGIPPNDRRNSCLSTAVPVNPGQAPPTAAEDAIVDLVADRAVRRGLASNCRGPSYEIRLSCLWTELHRQPKVELLLNPNCDHSLLGRLRVVPLQVTSSTPLKKLFSAAYTHISGRPIVLRSRIPIALQTICLECGAMLHKPIALGTGLQHRCALCGSDEMLADESSVTHELSEEQVGGWCAADIGLPKWSWITFASPRGNTVTFELAADAEKLLGRGERE